jgi:hypothetical protein
MDATAKKDGGYQFCPMCGHVIATACKQCPACGEVILPPKPVAQGGDLVLAFVTGGLSFAVCGFFFVMFIEAWLWPIPEAHAWMVLYFSFFGTCIVTAWLWGPPVIVIRFFATKFTKPIPAWRIFWQTQAIMYALSIGLFILCFGRYLTS